MRMFKVIRNQDESGISGTGHVIDGVIFDDGTTVIKWLSEYTSIAIYKSFDDFKFLHIDSHPTNDTEVIFVPTKQSESMTTKTECCGKCSHDEDVKCPECGEDKHYRIIYTDDEMTEVDFYDCMVCHTHWSWEHV